MAAYFLTPTSGELLRAFKKAIDDGHVTTWSYDKDGDFTHTTPQWQNRAWFRPKEMTDRLVMGILGPTNAKITTEVYAIYHGRMIESMLAHCDKLFKQAYATALPDLSESVG